MEDAPNETSSPNAIAQSLTSDQAMSTSPLSKPSKRKEADQDENDSDSEEQPPVKRRKKRSNGSVSGKKSRPSINRNGSKEQQSAKEIPATVTQSLEEGSMSGDDEAVSEGGKASNGESDENPADTLEKHEIIHANLKASGKDPYPDWKAGDAVPYAALCTTFSLIEMTTKRLEMTAHCSLFLQQVLRLTPGDLLSTVQLMINKVAADYAGIELGIGESLIIKAISETTGRTLADTKADHHKIGDLGLVAAKSRSNQRTMFKPKPLTVKGVHDGLLAIASLQGHGAQERKVNSIKKLLSSADAAAAAKGQKGIDITNDRGGASESKFLIRFLEGKLRLGLAEKTVIVALAQAMVKHEAAQKGNKLPSTEQMAKGESILKTVYR